MVSTRSTSGSRPQAGWYRGPRGSSLGVDTLDDRRPRRPADAGEPSDDLPEGLPHRHRVGPQQPALPRDRGAGAGLLGSRRHLPGLHRPARPGRARRERVRLLRRPALRQRPAALRPPAHRLRQGPRPALPDDARQARRAPLRLGHPRPARRAGGDAPERHQDHRRDRRARHREVQRRLPRVGDAVHRRVARLRDPPGALGGLRQRLQDDEPGLHGVGHLGVQVAARQGPGLRGLPGPALLLERRDPAVQPRAADGRRRLQGRPGPRGHRGPADARHRRGRGPRRRPPAGVDDHAVDAAQPPGRDGRLRDRLRRRRGAPPGHRGEGEVRRRGGAAGGVQARALPRRRRGDRPRPLHRCSAAGSHLRPAVHLLREPRERLPRRGRRRRGDHHRRCRPGAHRRRVR